MSLLGHMKLVTFQMDTKLLTDGSGKTAHTQIILLCLHLLETFISIMYGKASNFRVLTAIHVL